MRNEADLYHGCWYTEAVALDNVSNFQLKKKCQGVLKKNIEIIL